jgi:hypothetical protein
MNCSWKTFLTLVKHEKCEMKVVQLEKVLECRSGVEVGRAAASDNTFTKPALSLNNHVFLCHRLSKLLFSSLNDLE